MSAWKSARLPSLLVLIPALDLLFRYVIAKRLGVIIMSALIAHMAWHWMIERGEQLAKFPFPKIDAEFLASAMRGLMAMLILALAVLLANSWLKRWIQVDKFAPAKDAVAAAGRRELGRVLIHRELLVSSDSETRKRTRCTMVRTSESKDTKAIPAANGCMPQPLVRHCRA